MKCDRVCGYKLVMSYTQNDLDVVEAAIAAGVRRVKYADGKEIEYASNADLQQARRTILAGLSAGTPTAHTYPRHQLADFSDD